MVSLDDFLKAKDLDDLLKIRGQIGGLTADEMKRVADILQEWQDGQAVSNLLFHPSLIPEHMRYDSIDRALRSIEKPYFTLAAVVALRSIDPGTVSLDVRKRWVSRLLEFVRLDGGTLSSRASVTIWSWLRDDDIQKFVRAYPVPDETATENIIAFTISRFGHLTRPEYRERLRLYSLGFWKRRPFLRRFDEYCQKKDAGGAVFMTMPLLSYIPNYGSVKS